MKVKGGLLGTLKKKGEGNKNNREDNHDQSTLFAYMEMSW
jgi:hypothetical protein